MCTVVVLWEQAESPSICHYQITTRVDISSLKRPAVDRHRVGYTVQKRRHTAAEKTRSGSAPGLKYTVSRQPTKPSHSLRGFCDNACRIKYRRLHIVATSAQSTAEVALLAPGICKPCISTCSTRQATTAFDARTLRAELIVSTRNSALLLPKTQLY